MSDTPANLIEKLDSASLWVLNTHFKELLKRARHVGYTQGEAAAARLAWQLRRLYDPEELAEIAFLSIPRGGQFVLGWLAYHLKLRPEQLTPPFPPDQRLCLVDDAAFSGKRLRETLHALPHSRICVALLYASTLLVEAIVAQEERVEKAVSAYTLQVSEAGKEETAVPIDPSRYRHDQVEIVTFAWSETDKAVFNPFTQQEEYDWRLASPHRCLKNRLELGQQLPTKVEPDLVVPDEVVYALRGESIWLLQTETGNAYRLAGAAADLWRAVAASGNAQAALKYLAHLSPELEQILERLINLQLLAPC